MEPDLGDRFSNAQAYEGYVGRWSRLVAWQFIPWLGVAPGQAWLDMGAGTGILTQVILEVAAPARVVGIDSSPDYIEFARQRRQHDHVEFRIADASAMAFAESPFDAAVAGLVLNFVPSPELAVNSMIQSVRGGGLVAAYVWDYGGQMEMMRHFWEAAIQVDPAAAAADAGQRFAICKPENLRALFETARLNAVTVQPIDIQTRFNDFDDYWLPFLGAQGSVSKYLRGLTAETLAAIRDQLRRQLPITADGSLSLVARAWAVKGTKAV